MRTRVAALAAVLLATAGTAAGAAAPAPDSGLIVFSEGWVTTLDWDPQHDDPPDTTTIVCGVDLDGHTYRLSEPDVWSGPPSGPVWAPDGIHYGATFTGHVPGLVTYNVGIDGLDGSARWGPYGTLAAWSPDGTQLAYHLPNSSDIAISPATGNGLGERVVASGGGVSWSPDGAELAVAREDGVHAVRLAGGDRLVAAGAADPDWSPDGTTIALVRTPKGGTSTLALARADGGEVRDLGIAGSAPTWSPSGARLAYVTPRGIVAANADGSSPRLLYRGGSGPIDWQPVPHPELVANRAPCVIRPLPGERSIEGSAFDDNIWGTGAPETIDAGAGNDVADAGAGGDVVSGGTGADELGGGLGADRLAGGPGRDVLEGGPGNDVIDARDGERDRVACGPGDDRVLADAVDVVAADCERVNGADVLRGDTSGPGTNAFGPVVEMNYVNDHSSFGVTVIASDDGSGVARVWIERDDGRVVARRAGTCRATKATRVPRGRICGRSLTLSTHISTKGLPERAVTFRARAVDAAGNVAGRAAWTLYVDKHGPRARRLDVWFYDRRLHKAWIDVLGADPPLADHVDGSGLGRLVRRFRVNDGAWSPWTDPDRGGDTLTPVLDPVGVLPGDVVHAQVRETDSVGNVGPVVSLSTRVRGTEANVANLPPAPNADGPPVASVSGAGVRAGFANGRAQIPFVATGESYAGVVDVRLDEQASGRIVGEATCTASCGYDLSVGASVDTSSLPEGTIVLVATARDAAGKTGTSAKVRLSIDRTPPAPPRIASCRWLPERRVLAMWWAAHDPSLRDGTPGSTTATIRWRYRTGNRWSTWRTDGDGHGLMRTLYAPARHATVEAVAVDLVGNASRANVSACGGGAASRWD